MKQQNGLTLVMWLKDNNWNQLSYALGPDWFKSDIRGCQRQVLHRATSSLPSEEILHYVHLTFSTEKAGA